MSIFRYDSRHKIVAGILVILASATGFYLRDREKPSYENGQSKQVGSQVDGLNHGLWVWYHPNGKKKMQGRFDRGKREGIWITFNHNGDTITVSNYEEDKLNGDFLVFSDGKVSQQGRFHDDIRVN